MIFLLYENVQWNILRLSSLQLMFLSFSTTGHLSTKSFANTTEFFSVLSTLLPMSKTVTVA